MVDIQVEGTNFVLTVHGADRLWSLRSHLTIPIAHVSDVHTDASPKMGWFSGLKIAGTDIPNVFRAGTFYQDGGWVFWDVRHPENTIVLELHDERFQKLVVEVESPTETVRVLNQAISAGG
jgi:hypothetical protein